MSEQPRSSYMGQPPEAATPPRGLRAVHRRVENGMSVAAGFVALVTMVLMSVDTFGRYLLGSPITGTYEMVERVLMVLIVWLAVPRTLRTGGHVSVLIFVQELSRRAGALLRFVPQLVAAGIWGYVAYRSFTRGLDRLDSIVPTTAVPFPQGLPWLIMAVGAALLALRALTDNVLQFLDKPTDKELYDQMMVTDE